MGDKIHALLAQAKRESESDSPDKSSIAYATRELSNEREAEAAFERLKRKLFHVNKWNTKSGVSSFELFDEGGNSVDKKANVNDFIKITLPGTGKADWVKITNIHEARDEVVLTVQPSENPMPKAFESKSVTSHFFTHDASNNFCLERKGIEINLYVIGLREKSNTEDTKNFLETIRNLAVANFGHYLGVQKGEWTTFCENFLDSET